MQSRNRCFLWVLPTEVIVAIVETLEDDQLCFVSLPTKRHGDSEDWETPAAVVEEVVAVVLHRDDGAVDVVAVDDNTTKEHEHIHDAEHHVTEVRSAVGQSEDADNCPSVVNGVVPPRCGEGWDNHQQQQSLGRNTFGTFRWSSMDGPEEMPLRNCELLPT